MSNIITELSIFFSAPFVQRAILVGALISLCAALLGVSLVLKRYSMIGDGLSHVGFGALAIASALNVADATLQVSIPIVVIAAFFLLRISENSNIKGDSAIALISTLSLAVGYIVMYRKGTNVDVLNYMFGNIFTLTARDAVWSVILALVVLVLFVFFYYKIFTVTFDESFSKAVGIRAQLYNMIIAVLTAIVVVLGMRMMGTLLISALIIFPTLISMKLFKSFLGVVISSAVFSVLCFFAGIISAHLLDTPAGSTIVATNGIVLVTVTIISNIIKRQAQRS